MTDSSLSHLPHEINEDIKKLQSDTNIATIIIRLLDFALRIILAVEFKAYRLTHAFPRRNGYRERVYYLPVGILTLKIPRVRKGYFEPTVEKRLRKYEMTKLDETITQYYIRGFSIRDIEEILKVQSLKSIKKSQISARIRKYTDEILECYRLKKIEDYYPILFVDALYETIRLENRCRKLAVIVVFGLRLDGKRADVLDIYPLLGESEDTYCTVFDHLKEIGLKNPFLVISDCHKGLTRAIKTSFPGAAWQRCAVHLCRAVFRKLPKKLKFQKRKDFTGAVRDVFFKAKSKEEALELAKKVIEDYASSFGEAVEIFEDGYRDSLTFFDFEKLDPILIRTTNPIERFNRQIRKRSKSSILYPDVEAYLRQIVSYLGECVDTTLERKYFSGESLLETLIEEEALLETLPEEIQELVSVLKRELDAPERDFVVETLPAESEKTVLIALTDEASLKSREGGVLQIARQNYSCLIGGKVRIVEVEASVLVDTRGYAQPLLLRVSAEENLQEGARANARLLKKTATTPLLLCADVLSRKDYNLYRETFPDTRIQKDLDAILGRCVSFIPKGDRKDQQKRLKEMFTKSTDLKDLTENFEKTLSELKEDHPGAYLFLKDEIDQLSGCFELNSTKRPVRRMMNASLADDIFKALKPRLGEVSVPTLEKLVLSLIEACDELSFKWQVKAKNCAIKPDNFLPDQ